MSKVSRFITKLIISFIAISNCAFAGTMRVNLPVLVNGGAKVYHLAGG